MDVASITKAPEQSGALLLKTLAFIGRTLNRMEHRGVEYSIVQGVERGKWMWSLSLDTNVKSSGQADNKLAAVIAAERAIDRALEAQDRGEARSRHGD
jgi:hypothetical protein